MKEEPLSRQQRERLVHSLRESPALDPASFAAILAIAEPVVVSRSEDEIVIGPAPQAAR